MVKVQQRGLGKGLSALISENRDAAPAAPPVLTAEPAPQSALGTRDIHTSKLIPGKYQPRTRFTEEMLQELSDSIAKNGIVQPILVRMVTSANKETYEIIAGERRWRAAVMAGLSHIPAVVRELSDQQALELALIENVQRADLTPIEEATGYQRLLEEFGYTQDELSQVLGKSRSHIANLLRLLALPEDIRKLMDEGKLTMGHARALLNAKDASSIAQAIVDRGLSVRQTEAMARASYGMPRATPGRSARTGKPRASGPKDPDIIALEETMTATLGMQVTINDEGQQGELVITYESLAQLDDVLRRLGGGL